MGGSRLEVRDSEAPPELAVFLDDDERSGATLEQRTVSTPTLWAAKRSTTAPSPDP